MAWAWPIADQDRPRRFIPTRVHAVLDYLLAALLVFGPLVSPHAVSGGVHWIVSLLGVGILVYTLLTNFELGIAGIVPVPVHLALDAAGGLVLLALAAWGGAAHGPAITLGVLGVLEIGASLLTRTAPAGEPVHTDANPSNTSSLTARVPSAMPYADGPRTQSGRPISPVAPERVTNVEQLRRAIDSGATGDKIAMTDPATVPLGGDDEAGQLHDEEGLATARRQSAGS